MSDQTNPTNSSINVYEYLQISPNPDGTITRNTSKFPNTAANPDPDHPSLVLSKDIPINQSNNTWVRVFLPQQALDPSSSIGKLPLILYIHGGGFILMSAASAIFQDFSWSLATELPAIVVSVEYRLAPEHRLPTAYVDAAEALHWIQTTQEPWLRQYADYSNCYIMGSSAGGNIAYHAGLQAAAEVNSHDPMKIKGLILHQPFFGGAERSKSEKRLVNDPVLPPAVSDVMWDLSLPKGVDRDHEYCNPTVAGGSKLLNQIALLGWRVLVTGCDGDPLIDRQIELVNLMKEKGVDVVSDFVDGDYHGVEIIDPSKAKGLLVILKNFISCAV